MKKIKKAISLLISILMIWEGIAGNQIIKANAAGINSAPTVTDTSIAFSTISEDADDSSNTGMSVSKLLSLAGASDADSNTLSLAITSVDDTNGTWQLYYGGGWCQLTRYKNSVSDSDVYLVPNGCSVRFKPGSDFSGQASFTFRVWDESTGTADNNDTADSGNNAAVDASGSSNGGSTAFSSKTVTASISVTAVNDAPEIHKTGLYNTLRFDGTNDYVQVPGDLGISNGSFTVEGWIKADRVTSFGRFYDFGSDQGDNGGHNVLADFDGNNDKMGFEIWNGGNRTNNPLPMVRTQSEESFPLATWVYLTTVYDSVHQTAYMYWNGVLKASKTVPSTSETLARTYNYFGRSLWPNDGYFDGEMRNISVWKEARTAGEVTSDMNANFSGSETNLLLYYPVTDAAGSTTVASTTDTHTGNLMNYSSNSGAENSSANDAMVVNDDVFIYQVTGFVGTNIPIDQMYLKDVDAGAAGVSLQLSTAGGGKLAADPVSGVSITGSNTSTLTLSGTVDDINAALKTLTYNSASAITDAITAKVDDNGNSGSGGALDSSKTITVTVIAPPANTPTISEQPKSTTTHPGEAAVFSVTASGSSTVAYQWQLSKDGGSTWSDLPGATNSSYTINPTAKSDDGNQYRCSVFDAADNTSIMSEKATLTVLYPILKMAGVTPTNGSTGVAVSTQLSMTFNEDIQTVPGKNISVVDSTGKSIAVDTSSSDVSVSGSTVTVTLPETLGYTTKYHVLIDDGAFTDSNETAYGGISDTTAWCFKTEAAPAVEPAPPIAGSGSALSFDDVSKNYVDLGESNSNLVLGKTYTEEAWIYFSPVDNTSTTDKFYGILGNDIGSTYTRAPSIWVYQNGRIHAGFGDGSHWCCFVTPGDVLTPGMWNHVAVTYNGDAFYLYINGVLKYQETQTATPYSTSVRFIGKVATDTILSGDEFDGKIDEVKIWNNARTLDEIRQDMYNRPATGTGGLVGYWSFDENSISTAVDSSGNRSNGTLTNMDTSLCRTDSGAWQNRVTAENTPITIDAGHSRYGGSIVLDQSAKPSNGTLSFNNTAGTVTYTPNTGYHGTDTFAYTVTESGLSKSYTINMTVVQQPDLTGPSDQTAIVGHTATFSVGASDSNGGTVSYQWQKYTDGAWTDIPGAANEEYTTGMLAMSDSNGQYRCVAANTIGFTTAVTTSGAATLTVTQQVPALSVTASPDSPQSYPVNIMLSAKLGSYYGTLGGQTIDFYDGKHPDPIGSATTNSSGVASFSWTKPDAAGYSVTAKFAGDTNNAPVTSSALSYGISQGTQSQLTITGLTSRTYGDNAFSLNSGVSGGSGSGALHFSSSNTAVLTVDELTGNVTIIGAGSATISVYKAGDGNYSQSNTAALPITVTKKALNITITPNNKVYDGSASATVGEISYSGIIGTDDVSISGMTLTFSDKKAGTDKTVTAADYSLIGAKAVNYMLGVITVNSADITQKALTVTTTSVNSKTYDGTITADFSATPALSGMIAGDSVALSGGAPTFASKNVGNGIMVNFSPFSLTGNDAGNYSLTQPSSTTANITPAMLTVSVNPISIKGGQSINDHIKVSVTGFVGGESSSLAGFMAPTAAAKNANEDNLMAGTRSIRITYSGGTSTGNYQFDESNVAANLTITSAAVGSGDYTVTGAFGSWSESQNPSAWSNSSLTVSPAGGYDLISANGSNWENSLNISDEAKNGAFTFCLKASDGTTSDSKTIYYNLDKTAPETPTITMTSNPVKQILHVISFGFVF